MRSIFYSGKGNTLELTMLMANECRRVCVSFVKHLCGDTNASVKVPEASDVAPCAVSLPQEISMRKISAVRRNKLERA